MIKPSLKLLVTLLVAVIAAMFLLRECSTQVRDNTREFYPGNGDTINVAIEYSPLSLYRYDDTLGGFNYDMLRMVLTREGMKLKFYPVASLEGALDGLETGKFDIVVADIPVTAGFKEKYRFTEPVFLDRQILVSNDTTVHSQLDLARKTVYVPSGSPAADRLRNLSHEIGDTIYVIEDSGYGAEQLFTLAAVGEIPLAVVNRATAVKLAADYPDTDISTPISFTQFQSWVMSRDSTARADSIDAAIHRFKNTQEYRTLLRRYGIGE